jgi:hypothetical protein
VVGWVVLSGAMLFVVACLVVIVIAAKSSPYDR